MEEGRNQKERRELLDELMFLSSFAFTNPVETPEQEAFDRTVHDRIREIQLRLIEAGMQPPAPIPDGLR